MLSSYLRVALGLFASLALQGEPATPPAVAPAPTPHLSPSDAAAIARTLSEAPQQGLPAAKLPDPGSPDYVAQVQKAAIAFAEAEHGLIRDPESLDAEFALKAPFDAPDGFATAVASGGAPAWVQSQFRHDPDYLALVAARAQYAKSVASSPLNFIARSRLAAIDANLERMRWAPVDLPATRVVADVGGPEVTLFVDDKVALDMRAVAGEAKRQTPTFASEVTAVEFNPPWIVPPDIAKSEILPKGRGYLRRHDFYVSDGRVIQRAGSHSSLGYVKFEVTDPFEVYLHDTPSRADFSRGLRFLSHGCIRVQEPRELAATLLGWAPDQVDAAIAAKATHTESLKSPIPLFVVYRTVLLGPGGKLLFRPDVYGWDSEVDAALAGRPQPSGGAATQAAP
jgi:hypothetical protein